MSERTLFEIVDEVLDSRHDFVSLGNEAERKRLASMIADAVSMEIVQRRKPDDGRFEEMIDMNNRLNVECGRNREHLKALHYLVPETHEYISEFGTIDHDKITGDKAALAVYAQAKRGQELAQRNRKTLLKESHLG